jgi:hypothetical protein
MPGGNFKYLVEMPRKKLRDGGVNLKIFARALPEPGERWWDSYVFSEPGILKPHVTVNWFPRIIYLLSE